jgi:hypothetical protein
MICFKSFPFGNTELIKSAFVYKLGFHAVRILVQLRQLFDRFIIAQDFRDDLN